MKHYFRTNLFVDLALLGIIVIAYGCTIIFNSYAAGIIDWVEISNPSVISSPSPQILPKTSTLDQPQEITYTLHTTGVASYYDYSFPGDKIGQEWSKLHDTCATRGWNRYGRARVTNLANGKSVICKINDDGPRDCEYRYKYKLDKPGECIERIIDLSSHAFKQIADTKLGLINVKVEMVEEFSSSNK